MKAELTFEKALARLEQIVAQLDAGDLPLDESPQAICEGSELGKFCSAILDQAEGRLRCLSREKTAIRKWRLSRASWAS